MTGNTRRDKKPTGRRGGTSERRQLFAAAWIASGGNGRVAAREAGYRGSDKALYVTASRLLKHEEVRSMIDARVQRAEQQITDGGMSEAEAIARLTAIARGSLEPFIRFVGGGFELDVAQGLKAGMGPLLSELTHDAETGAPRIWLHDPLKAIHLLARLKGWMRDDSPPAPQPNLTIVNVLRSLPDDALLALNAAMEAEAERQASVTIDVTAVTPDSAS
jgi:hypothetical protein